MLITRRAVVAGSLALAAGSRAGARPNATRLDVRGDRIFVPVRVNGVATTAVLDSAAEMTVLDRAFAAPLALHGGEAVTARGTGAATTAATLVGGAQIDVAGRLLAPATVAVIDLTELSGRVGQRIDVILGRDLFDAGRLALDLAGGTLRRANADDPPGVALPLTPRRGIETVPITIEGIAATADFDLGNGGTVLVGAEFATRHRLLDRVTGTIPGGGIGGATRETSLTLASLDLAGHRFTGVPAAIDTSPTAADANVGVRLLRRFAIVTDFPAQRVWLAWRGMTLAAFATDPAASRGRAHPEPASATRDPFQRDRDRIVHATAFRRLRDKTQVFVAPDGDHFRVRLTHSLEVAQIARTLARALGLNEDLTEACALAHDLGHPPFGHSGEDALAAAMAPAGGFDHNAHTLRIVTRLEVRYPAFDGLNLSWETLEGLAKHNGPVPDPTWALAAADAAFTLDLATWPGLEAQVAAAADDIAYDNHDLDDGLRAGLFGLDEVAAAVPFVGDGLAGLTRRWPRLRERRRLVPELIRDQIGRMVDDLLAESRLRIAAAGVASAAEVRSAGQPLVGFSSAMAAAAATLKAFLRARMYTHPDVARLRDPAQAVVAGLFAAVAADPAALPDRWRTTLPSADPDRTRHIGDFIAGMTDRYALKTYERLVGRSPLPPDNLP